MKSSSLPALPPIPTVRSAAATAANLSPNSNANLNSNANPNPNPRFRARGLTLATPTSSGHPGPSSPRSPKPLAAAAPHSPTSVVVGSSSSPRHPSHPQPPPVHHPNHPQSQLQSQSLGLASSSPRARGLTMMGTGGGSPTSPSVFASSPSSPSSFLSSPPSNLSPSSSSLSPSSLSPSGRTFRRASTINFANQPAGGMGAADVGSAAPGTSPKPPKPSYPYPVSISSHSDFSPGSPSPRPLDDYTPSPGSPSSISSPSSRPPPPEKDPTSPGGRSTIMRRRMTVASDSRGSAVDGVGHSAGSHGTLLAPIRQPAPSNSTAGGSQNPTIHPAALRNTRHITNRKTMSHLDIGQPRSGGEFAVPPMKSSRSAQNLFVGFEQEVESLIRIEEEQESHDRRNAKDFFKLVLRSHFGTDRRLTDFRSSLLSKEEKDRLREIQKNEAESHNKDDDEFEKLRLAEMEEQSQEDVTMAQQLHVVLAVKRIIRFWRKYSKRKRSHSRNAS